MRRVAVVTLFSLLTGAFAAHALGDNPQIATNARDQSLATRSVVQLSDFTAGSGWSGGPSTSNDSDTSRCTFNPRQSDLVQTGEAESTFKYKVPLLAVWSSATVYRTEGMARLSWERARPGLLGFLRCIVKSALPSSAAAITVEPMSFPRLGTEVGADRTTFDVAAGQTKIGMLIDGDFVVSGRTILGLIQFAPSSGADSVKAGEIRLAGAMTARASALSA
jgi:hypothetical protein